MGQKVHPNGFGRAFTEGGTAVFAPNKLFGEL